MYRVGQVVVDVGWDDIDFGHFTSCPHSAWLAESLAEWAEEMGKMKKLSNQNPPNLGP